MTTVDDQVEQRVTVRRVVVAPPRPVRDTPPRPVRDVPPQPEPRPGARPVPRPARRQSTGPRTEDGTAAAIPASPTTSIGNVLIAFGVGLVLATIFGARGLVHSGHGMSDGVERTITLTVGNGVLQATQVLHLTAPWDEAEMALGRTPVQSGSPLLASAGSGPSTVGQLPIQPRVPHPVAVPATAGRHPVAGAIRPQEHNPRTVHHPRPHQGRAPILSTPTARNPLRLLVTGDSLTEFLGPQLDNLAARTGRIRSSADTHYGTGLVRPDFVDWSVVARQQVAEYHPEAVVVFIGGNDFQNIAMPNGQILQASSPAWTREYQRRAAVVMRTWMQGGARRVYWLSMPPARSDAWSYNNAQIDLALRRAAKQVPGAEYLNILGPITNRGRYADYVQWAGQPVLVRAPDGIHLSETGSSIVASEVLAVVKREWHLEARR